MKQLNSTNFKMSLLITAFLLTSAIGFAQTALVFSIGQASTADAGQGSRYQALLRMTIRFDTREAIQKMSFVLSGKDNIKSLQLYAANGNDGTYRFWFLPMADAITSFPSDTVTFITNGPAVYNLNAGGDNNFYLVMEVKDAATIDALIDASCIGATISNMNLVPTTAVNPAGTRKIVAPLSGTYTVKGVPGPTNYTSLTAAITDYNNRGSKNGVTFVLSDDSTFNGAYRNSYIYQTGSATNPILFKRSGTGTAKPKVQTTVNNSGDDACFTFWGTDHVTIDGLDMRGPSIAADYAEYGIRLMNSRDDGCQNITIQNSVITLDSTKDGRGIYTSRYVPIISTDGNDNKLRILNNTIKQVRRGIFLDNGNLSNFSEDSVWIEGNIISNVAINDNNAAIYTRDIKNLFIRNNEVKDIRLGTNYQNTFRGIEGAAINLYITGNKIHGITNPSNAFNNIRNIGILAYSQNNYIINNMIWDINVSSGNIVAAGNEVLRGISVEGYNNIGYCYVYNNTVVLNSPTSGTLAQWSNAIYVNNNITWCEMKNNIAISMCTGIAKNIPLNYAISPTRTYSKESNNNIFYSGTPSASNIIARVDGADRQTLLAYKQNMLGIDLNTQTENTSFVGADNVHINTAVATFAESGGLPIAMVTTDIDGDVRNATKPDIGADEGVFIANINDTLGPKIVHIPMTDTTLLTAPTLIFSITDSSKVDTTLNKPRVYYRKVQNGNAFLGNLIGNNGWKWVEPSNNSSPFSFTLNWAILNGGVPVADGTNNSLIEYFVMAQDYHVNPNLTVYPPNGTYTATTVSNISAINIGNRYRYRILNATPYSGDYLVGVGDGEPFATLAAAATALNAGYISGPVRLLLNDASYAHGTTVPTFNQIKGASKTNTITIKPAPGVKPYISYTPTGDDITALLFNGCDYVIIDGSNTIGGTTRDLTIQTTTTPYRGGIINFRTVYNADGTINGAKNNVVKNCIITGPTTAGVIADDLYGITSAGAPRGTGDNNDSLLIENNIIKNLYIGIEVRGNQTGIYKGITIRNNTLDSLKRSGIDIERINGATISGNTIKNVESGATTGDYAGIYVRTSVTNAVISNNIIDKVTNTSPGDVNTDRWNAGIYVDAGINNANYLISNNMISNVLSYNSNGIRLNNLGLFKVLHNTINLTGNASTFFLDRNTNHACIRINNVRDGFIQNNILMNCIKTSEPQTPVATLRNYKSYNVYIEQNPSPPNVTINNNAYWINNIGLTNKGYAGYQNADRRTLKDLQLLNAYELNGISDSIKFVSATDMHIDASKATKLDGAAALSVVTTDIDGEARDASKPDIGADEGTFISAASPLKSVVSITPSVVPIYNPNATIMLRALDINGAPVTTGGETVVFTVKNITGYSFGTVSATYDSLNGRYTAQFKATRSGSPLLIYATIGGSQVTDTAMISVLNNPPTNHVISKNKGNEGSANSFVGIFTTTDPDIALGDSAMYSLVAGTGSTDNALFKISKDSLLTNVAINFATKPTCSIRIRSTDKGGLFFEKVYIITINARPTNLLMNPSSIKDNISVGSVASILTATDPNGVLETFTYSLVSGPGDTNNASFHIAGNQLIVDSSFKMALTPKVYVRIKVADQDTLSFTKAFVITYNNAPTGVYLTRYFVNTGTTANNFVAKIKSIDPDTLMGDVFTYKLEPGGDSALFKVSNDSIRTNATITYSAVKPNLTITLRTTDYGGLTATKSVSVNINTAPTNHVLSNSKVNEGFNNAFVGKFTTTDVNIPDGESFTYVFTTGTGATDNALFKIVKDSLFTNAVINFATKPTCSIRIRSNDKGGLNYSKAYTIVINARPTNLQLLPSVINDSLPSGSMIATLAAVDPNGVAETFTYSLVAGAGDTHNAYFHLTGNQVYVDSSFKKALTPQIYIRVKAVDQDTLSYTKALVITYNNKPTGLYLTKYIIPEGLAIGTLATKIKTIDTDSLTDVYTYTLEPGGVDNALFKIGHDSLLVNAPILYATKSVLAVKIRTTDFAGSTFVKDTLIKLNAIPTNIVLSKTRINNGTAAGTFFAKLSTVDPGAWAGAKFVYAKVVGTGSTDNALVTLSNDSLFIVGAVNYATKPSYAIRLRTTDSLGVFFEKAIAIPVNTAPTVITASTAVLNDSTAKGTTIATLTATDPNGAETFTYTLVAGAGDTNNVSFHITGNQLICDSMFAYANTKFIYVRIQVMDTDSLIYQRGIVFGVNTRPTNILMSPQSVAEAQAKFASVGILNSVDPNGHALTYSLPAGVDNASFTLSSGNRVVTNEIFDYETKKTYTIIIRGTDPGGLYIDKQFTITVTNVYEAPSDITLSNSSVDENLPSNTLVGEFSSIDPDSADVVTYSLVTGTGSTNNGSFTIIGDSLVTNAIFDLETKASYSIRVRAKDLGNKTFDKIFSISVNDINEISIKEISVIASVYPIPTSGILNIKYKGDNRPAITLTDLYGRQVYSGYLNSEVTTLNLSNYAKGMYIIRITENNDVYTGSVTIE